MQTYIDYGLVRAAIPRSATFLLRPIEALCGRQLEPDVRVLEIGCGSGFFSAWFASFGCRVVGVDASEEQIGEARRAFPRARFEVARLDEDLLTRLGEEPFDLVVSTAPLGARADEDPRGFVRAAHAALLPGGRLICTTPFGGHLRNVAAEVRAAWGHEIQAVDARGRPRGWSRRAVGQLFAEEGFDHVHFRGVGRLPLLWKRVVVAADRPLEPLVRYGALSPLSA